MICVLQKELGNGCKVQRSVGDLSVFVIMSIRVIHTKHQIDVHYSLPRDDNLAKGGDKNQASEIIRILISDIITEYPCAGVARDIARDLAQL